MYGGLGRKRTLRTTQDGLGLTMVVTLIILVPPANLFAWAVHDLKRRRRHALPERWSRGQQLLRLPYGPAIPELVTAAVAVSKGLRKEMTMFFWLYVMVAFIVVFGAAVVINWRRRRSISYDSESAARLARARGEDNLRHG